MGTEPLRFTFPSGRVPLLREQDSVYAESSTRVGPTDILLSLVYDSTRFTSCCLRSTRALREQYV